MTEFKCAILMLLQVMYIYIFLKSYGLSFTDKILVRSGRILPC